MDAEETRGCTARRRANQRARQRIYTRSNAASFFRIVLVSPSVTFDMASRVECHAAGGCLSVFKMRCLN